MVEATCQHCTKTFIIKSGSFGKFCSLSCGTSFRTEQQAKIRRASYEISPKSCRHCNAPLPYDSRHNTYCSKSCSAKETNKIPRKRGPDKQEHHPFSKVNFYLCPKTNQWYSNRNSDGSFRRCSPYIKTEKQKYYSAARFRFNVYEYPEKFDLGLIEKHGWYSCPGKKRKKCERNIHGVSRDHLISVSYGFKHNIQPHIIAHPANCRIVLHSENKRKADLCSITIEELLKRIKEW